MDRETPAHTQVIWCLPYCDNSWEDPAPPSLPLGRRHAVSSSDSCLSAKCWPFSVCVKSSVPLLHEIKPLLLWDYLLPGAKQQLKRMQMDQSAGKLGCREQRWPGLVWATNAMAFLVHFLFTVGDFIFLASASCCREEHFSFSQNVLKTKWFFRFYLTFSGCFWFPFFKMNREVIHYSQMTQVQSLVQVKVPAEKRTCSMLMWPLKELMLFTLASVTIWAENGLFSLMF